jgi:putative tricarboxylic transport membrane protein
MPIDLIIQGASILFEPTNLLLILLSVPIGMVFGAIPGFTGTNTVALALPLTIPLEPVTALILMSALYVGTSYGGAIPAALINTPGTTAAAATVLDAYPMTVKGEAGKAIGISIVASVIGGLVATVLLLIFIYPIAEIAFLFGQVEYFVLALFGLVAVGVALGGNMRKGILAGMFGLLVAAMPADPTTAQNRLDFGFFALYDEVPFIPVIIGVFAVSELFFLINKHQISTGDEPDIGYSAVMSGARYAISRPFELGRAISIGTTVGALPGAGTSVANFISWIVAKNSSNDPDSFGEGNPSGVVASEASNNAVTAGSLIPTLTLGIPGSGTTAVMLGALLLHGLQPGPGLMDEFALEANAIMLSLFIANIVLLVFALFISKYIVRVVLLPTGWILPGILILTVIGAYALRVNMFDAWFMILFGFIGFLMRIHDYPLVPLVLGVILGPIAESAFLRGMLLSGDDPLVFFSSPIALIMWGLIVATILWKPLSSRIRPRLGI